MRSGQGDAPRSPNTLTLRENGPLELGGEVKLAGVPLGREATFCRCGRSADKPFCDGSHAGCGFTAAGMATGLEANADRQAGGAVDVRPIQDGPLRIDGVLELRSDSGEPLGCASQLWLCRCGESRRKPFCDGTHKRTGFRAGGEVRPQKLKPTDSRQVRGSDG
jgi:CDGSH-type Zn-finger protein